MAPSHPGVGSPARLGGMGFLRRLLARLLLPPLRNGSDTAGGKHCVAARIELLELYKDRMAEYHALRGDREVRTVMVFWAARKKHPGNRQLYGAWICTVNDGRPGQDALILLLSG